MIALRVFPGKLLRLFTHNLFHLPCRLVGRLECGIVRQPYIDVRPVLDVLREKRRVQTSENEKSQSQEEQGTEEELPSMFNRGFCRRRLQAEEPAVALLLQCLLHLLFRPQK